VTLRSFSVSSNYSHAPHVSSLIDIIYPANQANKLSSGFWPVSMVLNPTKRCCKSQIGKVYSIECFRTFIYWYTCYMIITPVVNTQSVRCILTYDHLTIDYLWIHFYLLPMTLPYSRQRVYNRGHAVTLLCSILILLINYECSLFVLDAVFNSCLAILNNHTLIMFFHFNVFH
jgi:hypothetical protein